MSPSRASLFAIPLAALAVAGCGGSSNGTAHAGAPSRASGQVLKLTANASGQLEFSPMSLTAKPGRVTLVMDNPSSSGLEHGVAVEGNGVDKDGPIVGPGGTSTLTVTLKRGTYRFYCPFDHHEQDGMRGTLTVR